MSALPYTLSHWVIRSFPLCGVKVLHPAQNDLSRPPAMATAKKQNNKKTIPWLSSPRSDWRDSQRRRQPTPTDLNIYTYIIYLVYNTWYILCIYKYVVAGYSIKNGSTNRPINRPTDLPIRHWRARKKKKQAGGHAPRRVTSRSGQHTKSKWVHVHSFHDFQRYGPQRSDRKVKNNLVLASIGAIGGVGGGGVLMSCMVEIVRP